jgi:hypothetical protein
MHRSPVAVAVALVLALALDSSVRVEIAFADPAPGLASTPDRPERRTWYGHHLLVTDAALLGFGLAIFASGGDEPFVPVAATFASGAIVHLIHARPGAAAASLALRLGLPLLGWAAGFYGFGCTTPEGGCGWPPIIGVTAGMASAMVIDATLLSSEVRRPPSESTRIAPTLQVSPGSAALGVSASF